MFLSTAKKPYSGKAAEKGSESLSEYEYLRPETLILFPDARILDYRQVVRHAVLIRIYAGSNPASPVGRVQDRYVRYDSNIPTPGSAWYTESLLYVWCKSTVSRLPLLRCKSESHIICVDQSRLSAWPETSGDNMLS